MVVLWTQDGEMPMAFLAFLRGNCGLTVIANHSSLTSLGMLWRGGSSFPILLLTHERQGGMLSKQRDFTCGVAQCRSSLDPDLQPLSGKGHKEVNILGLWTREIIVSVYLLMPPAFLEEKKKSQPRGARESQPPCRGIASQRESHEACMGLLDTQPQPCLQDGTSQGGPFLGPPQGTAHSPQPCPRLAQGLWESFIPPTQIHMGKP